MDHFALCSAPPRLLPLVERLLEEYQAVGNRHGFSDADLSCRLTALLTEADRLIDHPHTFSPLHEAIRTPVDYMELGLSFFEPLVDWSQSHRQGNWEEIEQRRRAGENTILLANHQTEGDPQLMHLLLRQDLETLAQAMRFMAGERVQKDPIAHPFSLGRHLVCVYSRRHIDHPPERKADKLTHNATAMRQLKELLAQGGVVLYLAPSGGRDRTNAFGEVELAPFDPDAVEMMRLMAGGCPRPTLCYPLALSTFDVLPPPAGVHLPLGEVRHTRGGPIGMSLGSPICWDQLPAGKEMRGARAQAIQQQTLELYRALQESITRTNRPTLA
jgi:glycerol-3-phosphate O-acyltransferase